MPGEYRCGPAERELCPRVVWPSQLLLQHQKSHSRLNPGVYKYLLLLPDLGILVIILIPKIGHLLITGNVSLASGNRSSPFGLKVTYRMSVSSLKLIDFEHGNSAILICVVILCLQGAGLGIDFKSLLRFQPKPGLE